MLDRDLVLVLGYARSGTSALTRVISLCGCGLPRALFGATDFNPTGHWEPVDATKLNVDFVSRHGVVSDPSMRVEELILAEEDREAYIGKIRAFLRDCPAGPVVVKEFRINELMEFWLEAARREEFSTKAVIALRHPQEVYASATAAFNRKPEGVAPVAQASIERLNTFWLKINLLAERHSRGIPRVIVEYSNLLKDWRAEVVRMSRSLEIDLQADASAIDGFLATDLHRNRYSGPVTETFGYSWTTRVYAILSGAAQDGALDLPSLDEIYHAYRSSARAFRLSMGGVENASTGQELREFIDRLPIWNSSGHIESKGQVGP